MHHARPSSMPGSQREAIQSAAAPDRYVVMPRVATGQYAGLHGDEHSWARRLSELPYDSALRIAYDRLSDLVPHGLHRDPAPCIDPVHKTIRLDLTALPDDVRKRMAMRVSAWHERQACDIGADLQHYSGDFSQAAHDLREIRHEHTETARQWKDVASMRAASVTLPIHQGDVYAHHDGFVAALDREISYGLEDMRDAVALPASPASDQELVQLHQAQQHMEHLRSVVAPAAIRRVMEAHRSEREMIVICLDYEASCIDAQMPGRTRAIIADQYRDLQRAPKFICPNTLAINDLCGCAVTGSPEQMRASYQALAHDHADLMPHVQRLLMRRALTNDHSEHVGVAIAAIQDPRPRS